MSESKNLLVSNQDGVTVVSFVHSKLLDETNIHELGANLLKLIDIDPNIKMVINFDSVEYLSSAVLGKLMAIHKKVSVGKGKVVLCGIVPNVLEVFKITKLDKLFNIESDIKNSLKSVKKVKKSWF
ncbi:MAG: anti-anti-sigma factor [Planctomycetota bacterium]|nr:MAG: anti-anti-sigma factor [Planctomycetota bacterium]